MDDRLHTTIVALMGALLLFFSDALAGESRYVILKLDDLKLGLDGNVVQPGFQRVADYLESKKIKAGFGVICNFLEDADPAYFEWVRKRAIENGGLVEFWHHGYDHGKAEPVDGVTAWREFSNTPYEVQKEHFEKAFRLMKEKTGITFHTFGAPFNATDETTKKMLAENSDIKVWFHGGSKTNTDKLVLGQAVLLEETVGIVTCDFFMQGYKARPKAKVLVLQGHPRSWSDASFADFTKIVDFLLTGGWQFVTPLEYSLLVKVQSAVVGK